MSLARCGNTEEHVKRLADRDENVSVRCSLQALKLRETCRSFVERVETKSGASHDEFSTVLDDRRVTEMLARALAT